VPAGTLPVVPDTTIESAKYNSLMNDIAADLNIARPIVAGGTSATTAAAALTNLGAVAKSGDTMTGELTIAKGTFPGAILNLNNTAPGTACSAITGKVNGAERWLLYLGDAIANSGGNSGSNFILARISDAGVLLGNSIHIVRSSGLITLNGNVNVVGSLTTSVGALHVTNPGYMAVYGRDGNNNTGEIYFNSSLNKSLRWDGTNFALSGELYANGTIVARNGQWPSFSNVSASGSINANGNISAAGYLYTDSVAIVNNPTGHPVITFRQNAVTRADFGYNIGSGESGVYTATGHVLTVNNSGGAKCGAGIISKAGTGTAAGGNLYNFYWSSPNLQAWIDASNIGNVSYVCDYRAKRNVEPLPSTWDAVKALNPISFCWKDYGQSKDADGKDILLFEDSDEPQWGFLAHELQETLLPSAATGSKDAENIVQSPNWLAVIAALTKTIQELQARVEALEAR
jgi:hypothetical protein